MKRPAFQFYPDDWTGDTELQSTSLGARGLWLELMCRMHKAEPYGQLVVAGKAPDLPALARIVRSTVGQVRGYIAELEEAGVFSRNEDGVIYSRRMVRDEVLREKRAAYGPLSQKNPHVPRPKDTRKDIDKDTLRPSFGGSPPSPSPSPTSTKRTNERRGDQAAKANPFVTGKRDEYETESMRLVREIEALTGEDGAEIFAKAAHYDGALRQKVNPAGLTDDRLLNTVIDLRATLRDEQAKRAVRV